MNVVVMCVNVLECNVCECSSKTKWSSVKAVSLGTSVFMLLQRAYSTNTKLFSEK